MSDLIISLMMAFLFGPVQTPYSHFREYESFPVEKERLTDYRRFTHLPTEPRSTTTRAGNVKVQFQDIYPTYYLKKEVIKSLKKRDLSIREKTRIRVKAPFTGLPPVAFSAFVFSANTELFGRAVRRCRLVTLQEKKQILLTPLYFKEPNSFGNGRRR